jgi:hypothetical protein
MAAEEKIKTLKKEISENKTSPSDGKLTTNGSTSGDFAYDNVLHRYNTYNYEITLSALGEEEIRNPKKLKEGDPHDVIAKSSGIGNKNTFKNNFQDPNLVTDFDESLIFDDYKFARKILERNLDIFFQSMVVTSVATPNSRRKLTNLSKVEFTLREPYGITLFQKLRAAAGNNGYIHHTDAPFLLTIAFKGQEDQLSSSYTKIPSAVRKIPIKITNITMKVDQAGTEYSGTAVPWTEFALVNRFLYTRSTITCKNPLRAKEPLANFFQQLEEGLQTQMDVEIGNNQREYADVYQFSADEYIHKLAWADLSNETKPTGFHETDIPDAPPYQFDLKLLPSSKITDYLTRNILKLPQFKGFQENFVQNYIYHFKKGVTPPSAKQFQENPEKWLQYLNELVPWFKIVTTVYTDKSRLDNITKQHPKTIRFHVKRYDIHSLNFLVPGLALTSLWGKYAKKRFNYIFTGQNQDILELNINYNYGYFQSSLSNAYQKAIQPERKDKTFVDKITSFFTNSGSSYPESLSPYTSYPSREQSYTPGVYTDSEKDTPSAQFFDYLTNPDGDMYKVDMKILGDPSFLGHDLFTPIEEKEGPRQNVGKSVTSSLGNVPATWDEETGSFNFDNAEPIVELNFKFPQDIDDKKGVFTAITSNETGQFNGIYKVTKVESVFDSGVFTQNLTMIRYKNQKVDSGKTSGIPVYEEFDDE